jgi:alpha-N-arabinofuranosidase
MPWSAKSRHLPPTPNLKAALADAAWMTGMERNSDLIVMQCYAPMLVNVNPGGRQWRPDLVGYNALNSFGSPSYYAMAMFNTNRGNVVVRTSLDGLAPDKIAPLDFSVTKNTKSGTIYIKLVNVTSTPQTSQIDLDGVKEIAPTGLSVVLKSAKLDDSNSITEPTNVVPIAQNIDGLGHVFMRTFAPYSVNILKIQTK